MARLFFLPSGYPFRREKDSILILKDVLKKKHQEEGADCDGERRVCSRPKITVLSTSCHLSCLIKNILD